MGCAPQSNTSLEQGVCNSDTFELKYKKIDKETYEYSCTPNLPFIFTDPLTGDEVYHKIFVRESNDDGKTWSKELDLNFYASVPEVFLVGEKYNLNVCGTCLVWDSMDGLNFNPKKFIFTNITDDDDPCQPRVDPAVDVNNDSVYSIFFKPNLEETKFEDPASQTSSHDIIGYESTDNGTTFSLDGILISGYTYTDPAIIRNYNGKDFIYVTSEGNKTLAYSQDISSLLGYQLQNDGNPVIEDLSLADVIRKPDGDLLMVGTRFSPETKKYKIVGYESSDGLNWSFLRDFFEDGESPSVYYDLSDKLKIVYVKKELVEE